MSRQITLYVPPNLHLEPSARETTLRKQLDRHFDSRIEKELEKELHNEVVANLRNRMGIFFPESYEPSANVDLIVYFHGLLDRCDGSASDSVEEYWANRHFRLRDWLNAAKKKNTVLVVPRLGPADSYMSKLGMQGDAFFKRVQDVISERVTTDPFNWSKGVKIRNIVLAAHSGGGSTIQYLASAVTVGKVCECWGLDSLYYLGNPYIVSRGVTWYDGVVGWLTWAARGGKIFLFWTDEGGTENNVSAFQKMLNERTPDSDLARPNVVIEYTPRPKTFSKATSSHCAVPKTYMPDLITRSGNCLS
jgi:hypothetical protein